jgi:ATPase subunit of ABC transporter with duplicated ATPase domains
MSLVRLQNVTVRFEERLVLREVFFRLQKGDRIGFVGRNGAGKTTLLKLILAEAGLGGEEPVLPTEGKVEITPGVKVGYFSQFSELDDDLSVRQVLEEVFADVRAVEAELETIATRLSDPDLDADAMDRALQRQADLFEIMEHRDGWEYPTRIETVLNKLGFSEAHRERPLHQLSGGWRNRAALAKILLEEPDILLLDEPTNYLDIEGVAWLEEWLRKIRGAFLLVSHDRHFLDRVVSRIMEVENYHLHDYPGDYTAYVREKQFRYKTLQKQFEHEEELLAYESEAIDDRRDAAKDPSGALKRKLADVKKRAEPRPVDIILTDIYQGLHVRENLLRVEDVSKSYGAQSLFTGVSFELHQGDRLAIVGANGSGKSTLLRVVTGQEPPDSGRVMWEGGVEPISFNRVMEGLDPKDTVSHAVNTVGMALNAPRKQVGRFLEMLRFSEMDQKQRIGTLSGGQKARVALAQCLLSGAAAIVLDEPTNHLDMTSIQVMERALAYFPGAVLMVSHDRFFLDKVATRLLVFEGTTVREINGNWTLWQAAQGGKAGR